jgi:hypothetical protein
MQLQQFSDRLTRWSKRLNDPGYIRKRSLETYRTLTSPLRLLPSFLIIGVQKGGTTSLYRYLEQHPSIASAYAKEVHFFDNHTQAYNYGKGLAWYRSNFVYQWQADITGEGTPDYIFDPNAPHRIAKALPEVKLIVLLRNPVDRAYSHYLHTVRAFWDADREPLSFEAAITEEANRINGEVERLRHEPSYFSYNYMHYSYLARGIYADQLKTWFQLYPKQQILILKSEDFFADPNPCFRKVLEFLNLSLFELPEYKSFNARYKNTEEMQPDTRQFLQDYFNPHNQRLQELLDQERFHLQQKSLGMGMVIRVMVVLTGLTLHGHN